MLVTIGQVLGIVGAVLRIVTAALLLGGLWRALERVTSGPDTRRAPWLGAAVALVGWQAGVWLLARSGFFRIGRIGALPLIPLAVVLPLLVGLTVLGRSRTIAAALDATSPRFLIALQTYRILGAVFLVQYALGRLPARFALPAGIGDVLVGVLAIPVARYVASRRAHAVGVGLAWNVLGVADLVNALLLGALTAAGALGAGAPAGGVPIGEYPLVMIPAYAVPLSLLLHAQSIRQLLRGGRARRPSLPGAEAAAAPPGYAGA